MGAGYINGNNPGSKTTVEFENSGTESRAIDAQDKVIIQHGDDCAHTMTVEDAIDGKGHAKEIFGDTYEERLETLESYAGGDSRVSSLPISRSLESYVSKFKAKDDAAEAARRAFPEETKFSGRLRSAATREIQAGTFDKSTYYKSVGLRFSNQQDAADQVRRSIDQFVSDNPQWTADDVILFNATIADFTNAANIESLYKTGTFEFGFSSEADMDKYYQNGITLTMPTTKSSRILGKLPAAAKLTQPTMESTEDEKMANAPKQPVPPYGPRTVEQ